MCTCSTKMTNEELDRIEEANFQGWVRIAKTVAAVVIVMMATMTVFAFFAPDYRGPWVILSMLISSTVGGIGEIVTRPTAAKSM